MAVKTPDFTTTGMLGQSSFSVMWQDDKARYHIWFGRNAEYAPASSNLEWLPKRERRNLRHDSEKRVVLYVNPPRGTKQGDPGYFPTRRLDAEGKRWAAVLEAATAYANSGAPEKATEERERREAERAEHEAAQSREAHGAATKERLAKFAAWLSKTSPGSSAAIDAKLLAQKLTNEQADRLSAFVHGLMD